MKIIQPSFYGELGRDSIFVYNGFIIKKIIKLVIISSRFPDNDITSVPGICCLVTEKGKEALISLGLSPEYFHLAVMQKEIGEKLFFIDIDAHCEGIEIFRGTKLKIEEEKYNTLRSLVNINKANVK